MGYLRNASYMPSEEERFREELVKLQELGISPSMRTKFENAQLHLTEAITELRKSRNQLPALEHCEELLLKIEQVLAIEKVGEEDIAL